MAKHRVLIISTNPAASNGLLERLLDSGCQVATAQSGDEAVRTAETVHPEVVLVDNAAQDFDPLDVSWQIRAKLDPARCPIFVFSCCGAQSEASSDSGCCSNGSTSNCFEELLNRVSAYLTQPTSKAADVITSHGLEIDRGRHRVVAEGCTIQLTPTEFRLLWELAQSPGYVFTRAELARTCLGPNTSAQARTIDAHVKSLRRKLDQYSCLVETVRGIGYRFSEQRFDPMSATA